MWTNLMFLSERKPNPVEMFRQGFSQQRETASYFGQQGNIELPDRAWTRLHWPPSDQILCWCLEKEKEKKKFSGSRGHGWTWCSDLFKVGCRGLAQQLLHRVLGLLGIYRQQRHWACSHDQTLSNLYWTSDLGQLMVILCIFHFSTMAPTVVTLIKASGTHFRLL